MLGLIKKDLYLILNNRNAIVIYLIMVGFFAIFAKMDISYILPFFFLSIFLSTFSYDEYNNFNGYVCTMPKGREYVVLSKNKEYLTSFIFWINFLCIKLVSCASNNLRIILFISLNKSVT